MYIIRLKQERWKVVYIIQYNILWLNNTKITHRKKWHAEDQEHHSTNKYSCSRTKTIRVICVNSVALSMDGDELWMPWVFGKPSTLIAMDLVELPNWLATRQLKVYWTLPVISGTVSRLSNDDWDVCTVMELLSSTRGMLFLSHLSWGWGEPL